MTKTKKHLGLRLTLGGAPNTPHTVVGLPGLYRPDQITPVGGPGEPSEDQARAADKARGAFVELVELTDAELEKARTRHTEDLDAARGGITAARKGVPVGAEVEQVSDETAAVTGG